MKVFFPFFAVFFLLFCTLFLRTEETTKQNIPKSTITESEIKTQIEPTIPQNDPPFQEMVKEYSVYVDPEGDFQLPLNGATGYAAVTLNVRELPTSDSTLLRSVPPGTGFTIEKEEGNWWFVDINGAQGYVYHPYCLVNLPDVLPSIHELSSLSKSMAVPVNSNNDMDWRTAPLSETMNESALKLREYCTQAGLTPLASEWWHFNDLDYLGKIGCIGDFSPYEVFSLPPTSMV